MKDSNTNLDDATPERIIEAGRQLFHERGYADVGVAEICQRAGVVKGSFYHFFSGKNDLFHSCLQRNAHKLSQGMDHMESLPLNGREQLLTLINKVIGNAARMQRDRGRILGCDIGHLAAGLNSFHEAPPAIAATAMKQWLARLQHWVTQGQIDGSLRQDLNPKEVAEALLALIQGMSVLGRSLNNLAMLKRIGRQAEALLPAPTGR